MDSKVKYGLVIIGSISVLVLGLFIASVLPGLSQDDIVEQSKVLENSTEEALSDIPSQPANNSTDAQAPFLIPVSGSMVATSLSELDTLSGTVVIGTVTDILPSKWNTDDGIRRGVNIDDIGDDDTMYTDIIVSVDSYLKGPLDQKEVRIRTEGGEDELVAMTVDYEPSFYEGEKVLVYLCEDTYPYFKDIGPEHFIVTGYSQGKFSLTDDGIAERPYEEPLKLDELTTAIENGDYSEFDVGVADGELIGYM